MSKLAALIEQEKLGILSPESATMLKEARRRGLISEPVDKIAEAVREVSASQAGVINAVVQAMKSLKPPVVNVQERNSPPVIPPDVNVEVKVPPATAEHLVGLTFRVNRDRRGLMESITIERSEGN